MSMDLFDYVSKASDYLPNVFGHAPVGVEGLLGADQTGALNKQANLSGLLGAAMALSVGMANQGAPRRAAQYILTALGAGVGAAQGQYKGALDMYEEQQKMAKLQAESAAIAQKQAAIRDLAKKYPKFANIIAIDPNKGFDAAYQEEVDAPIYAAFESVRNRRSTLNPPQGAAPQQPVGADGMVAPTMVDGQPTFPPVGVGGELDPVTKLMAERNDLIDVNSRITGLRGSDKHITSNNTRIDAIRKQIGDLSPGQFDFESFSRTIWDRYQPELQQIRAQAAGGMLTGEKLFDALSDLKKRSDEFAVKNTDFTNDVRRLSKEMFPDTPLYALDDKQVAQLNARIQKDKLAAATAGAPKLAVNTADPTAVTKAAMDVADKFNALTKSDREIRTRYDQLISAYKNPGLGGTGDAAMIYHVAKILDPEGAVREGDVAMIAGAKTYPDQLRAIANRFISNGKLLPGERDQLMSLGFQVVAGKQKTLDATTKQYRNYSKNFNVQNPEEEIRNPYSDFEKPQYRIIRFNGQDVRAQLSPKDGKYYVESGGKFYPVED